MRCFFLVPWDVFFLQQTVLLGKLVATAVQNVWIPWNCHLLCLPATPARCTEKRDKVVFFFMFQRQSNFLFC